jgi:hypothetical protein
MADRELIAAIRALPTDELLIYFFPLMIGSS